MPMLGDMLVVKCRGNKGGKMLSSLPRITRSKFTTTLSGELGELEPTIVTSDGEDKFVVMSIDEFARMSPFKQGGEMCRIHGKMFREVV